jgi:small subunit ribosomal protein S3
MGHKVNPKVFRLGQTITWPSRWFSKKNYSKQLREDIEIRRFLKNKLKEAGIEKVEIERSPDQITIIIVAGRPGIIIGRGGSGIEEIKKEINQKFLRGVKENIKINIKEIDNINLSAANIVYQIIVDIEKRMPFRRVMKQTIDKVMKAGALGVKVILSGRLNGAEIARTETLSEGKVPLHTLRANIDYSRDAAHTTYGAIGVKVWIYKGEVFEKDNQDKVKQF